LQWWLAFHRVSVCMVAKTPSCVEVSVQVAFVLVSQCSLTGGILQCQQCCRQRAFSGGVHSLFDPFQLQTCLLQEHVEWWSGAEDPQFVDLCGGQQEKPAASTPIVKRRKILMLRPSLSSSSVFPSFDETSSERPLLLVKRLPVSKR